MIVSRKTRKGATFALPLALIAVLVWADVDDTTLSNGATLEVSIEDPGEWKVPHDATDTDVNIMGSASIGLGVPDATIIYVMDHSGSTVNGGGACGSILACEKAFFVNLNAAAIADGSTDLVGVVKYAGSSSTALPLTDPTLASVNTAINSGGASGATNCAAGLASANALVVSLANTNGTSIVVLASDGLCNTGSSVASATATLAGNGAIVHSVAIGGGSNCTSNGGTGTLNQATANGGTCTAVPDPNNLPNIIQSLIGSTLESLEIEAGEEGSSAIDNADIVPDLPQNAAANVDYETTVPDREPGDHEICVTANGSDVLGDTASVDACEVAHVLQLQAGPSADVNDLNDGNEHTVSGVIAGGTGPARNIDFVVGGHNAATANPGAASIFAAIQSNEDFTYSVPQTCSSLGTDTITVSTTIAGMGDSIELSKEWVDGTPPEMSCDPTVNPHGKQEPQAPGSGVNEDGFYQLNSTDPTLNCAVTLSVVDGTGHIFPGPFDPGDIIKYTQDDSAPQEQKKMGSDKGKAGAVRWHIIGHGDLVVTSTDTSGNSSSATCFVPQPPK